MKRLAELQNGERLESFFVVASNRVGTTRKGDEFWTLTLRDVTGSMNGRVWQPSEACPQGLELPGVYTIVGRVDSYRDELQLVVDHMKPYRPTPEEYDSLVPASRWSPEVLESEIRAHIEANVRAAILKRLLLHAMDHPTVKPRLSVSPAASANHHAYRSGLAEHTLSMMRIATTLAGHYSAYYPGLVDGDLLIAGVLLHDLGKVWELEGDLAADYSTVGRLVGHIPMGAAFVADLARELGDIPDELVWELQHLVLSHHGQLEYGSPKRPKTIEAQILHYIDQIDAKTNTFFTALEKPGWTPFQRNMGRPLLNPADLRKTWTTPPPGETGTRGPGTAAGGDGPPTPSDDDAPPPEPYRDTSPESAERPRSAKSKPAPREARPKKEPASKPVGATPGSPSPEAPAPEPPPSTGTLNLFDGLE